MTSDPLVSRRRALQLFGLGVTGTAFLTACSPSEKAQGTKEFHGAWPYVVPPKGHFNIVTGVSDGLLAGAPNPGPYIDLITVPPAMYRWQEKKYEPLLAQEWKLDPAANTFTLKLKTGLQWSDGKPVTSKDVVTSYWCRRVMRNVAWDFLSKVEATDDQTVVFTLSKPSTVVERYVLRQQIYSDATYGQWAQQAEQLFASGKDLDSPEGEKLNQAFQAFRPDDVIASGPFRFDKGSITNAQLTLVKNGSGLGAGDLGFEKIVLYNGETPDITPPLLAKNVDYATHGFPTATEKEFVNKGFRILRPPTYAGGSLFMNFDRLPEFRDVRARRALALALDRQENGTVSLGESGKPVRFMAGFSDILVPDWLTPAEQQRLRRYDYDPDEAARELTAIGWRKSGNTWTKPNGQPAAYDISFPAEFADYSATGQNVAQQLTKFGFRITPRGVTHTQMPIDVDKGNFQLAVQAWGSSSHPHPHFAFVIDLFTHNIPVAKNQGGRGIGFELRQTTSAGPIDLERVVIAAGEGLDQAAQKRNVAAAALAFNELLPIIPLYERYGNNPALEGNRVKNWPADGDPILQNAPYADNFTVLLLLTGRLPAA
jgi:peptide/nickel transport system substrate-binding protein